MAKESRIFIKILFKYGEIVRLYLRPKKVIRTFDTSRFYSNIVVMFFSGLLDIACIFDYILLHVNDHQALKSVGKFELSVDVMHAQMLSQVNK